MKPIPSPFSRYALTEDGEVYSLIKRKPFMMKLFRDSDGYYRVTLRDDSSVKKQVIVSRLMYKTYIGSIPINQQIRHLDGDNGNNHISNLDIGTAKDNCSDRDSHGTTVKGEDVWAHRLTEKEVLAIRKSNKNRNELSIEFSVSISTIDKVITKQTWKHVKETK